MNLIIRWKIPWNMLVKSLGSASELEGPISNIIGLDQGYCKNLSKIELEKLTLITLDRTVWTIKKCSTHATLILFVFCVHKRRYVNLQALERQAHFRLFFFRIYVRSLPQKLSYLRRGERDMTWVYITVCTCFTKRPVRPSNIGYIFHVYTYIPSPLSLCVVS
jgi:hypothetical protein